MSIFNKKKQQPQQSQKYVICPYCEKRITEPEDQSDKIPVQIEYHDIYLVGCPHCKKIIAHYLVWDW